MKGFARTFNQKLDQVAKDLSKKVDGITKDKKTYHTLRPVQVRQFIL